MTHHQAPAIGRGTRLFEDGITVNLKLKHSKISSSGVLLTTYQVV
jgi:hypothetical protein